MGHHTGGAGSQFPCRPQRVFFSVGGLKPVAAPACSNVGMNLVSCKAEPWKLWKWKRLGQLVPRRSDTFVFWVSATKINYCCHGGNVSLRKATFPRNEWKNPYDALLALKTFILKWDICHLKKTKTFSDIITAPQDPLDLNIYCY